ncbi:MAG: polymer-forming cytoskeletal protein [Arenicellales bacterium]
MFKKPNETSYGEPSASDDIASPGNFRDSQNQHVGKVTEHKRSVLSPSITVKGDISGTEDLVLEGKMEGSINLPNNEIMIGPDGKVKANVTAMKVSVEGRLVGDIRGSERVVIKHSGRVEGNIVAPRVVLEDGCQFKGSVEMNIDSSAGSSASAKEAKGESKSDSKGKSDGSSHGQKIDQYSSETKPRVTTAS